MVYVTHDQAEAMVTSDRIAVMNKGRIEQIDAPYELYSRPRTKFVAGFIGRTNFLSGKANGELIDFGGFSVPGGKLRSETGLSGEIDVSIRPQSIVLHKHKPTAADDRCSVPGTVERSAYLGEYWDYHVTLPGVSQPLRVTSRPQDVFHVNDPVFVEIDTSQMTVISR
jgi:iron(III) transport system ATP-binding protein